MFIKVSEIICPNNLWKNTIEQVAINTVAQILLTMIWRKISAPGACLHGFVDGPAEIYVKRKNYHSLYGRILSNQCRHLSLSHVLCRLYRETLSKLLCNLYGEILSHYVTWSHFASGCPGFSMFSRSCSSHPGSVDCLRVLLQINLYLHAVLRGIK